MKQGGNWISACALVACMAGVVAIGAVADAPVAHAADKAATKSVASKSRGTGSRQFSGWVTALDKTTFTVEKRGKQPRTVVFSKHAEMKTAGDLEKDARVTVYYRDEDGQPMAHRVVVKPASRSGSSHSRAEGSSGATRGGR